MNERMPEASAMVTADMYDVYRRLAEEYDLMMYERWVHGHRRLPIINVLNRAIEW